nr:hypothetical protein DOP62_09270 [Synechococcus elongatus PCC 11801]
MLNLQQKMMEVMSIFLLHIIKIFSLLKVLLIHKDQMIIESLLLHVFSLSKSIFTKIKKLANCTVMPG